jgi:predicted dehydrogenase
VTERLRIALVGAGRIGGDWLAALEAAPAAVELVAVVDTDERARSAAAAPRNVPHFALAAEAWRETAPAAALVATPPATHESLVTELLDRGAHVLCEKPLATNAASATRMVHAAHRGGRRLMMASKFRYVPDVVQAQELVGQGLLGDLVLLENTFCARAPMAGRWNAEPGISGGGVLIDHGAHSADLVRCFLGPIVRVFAHPCRRVQPVVVEDTVRCLLESVRGTLAAVDLSWSIAKELDHYLLLHGSKGTMQLGWRGARWRCAGDEEWTAFGAGYDKRAAFATQLGNFAAAVRGAEPPRITPEDALESVRVIDAAYRSLRSTRWVPVHQHPANGY